MKTWLISLSLIFCFTDALADESILPLRKVLNDQERYLSTLVEGPRSESCDKRYRRLWKDGVLNIDWFYGYLDSEGIVVDRLYSQETRRFLQRPCRPGMRGACGFKVIADHSASLGPVILSRALTKNHRVVLRVWYSASSDWETKNSVGLGRFSIMNTAQRKKTTQVWKDFLRSLQSTEVVIYSGHSRVGTGPGFAPFSVLQTVGGTLFKYNLEKTRYALQSATKKPEVLMISSCESEKYYLATFHKAAPKTAIAVTQFEQSFGAGEQTAVAMIDSLVTGRCAKGMNQALQSANGPQDGGMRLYGFE